MVEILGLVGSALGVVGQLIQLRSVGKDAQAKLLLSDLQLKLAEVNTRLAELVTENTRLKQENAGLREELQKAASAVPEVVLKDGLYYKPDGDGPFCTACYDGKGKLVRVAELGSVFRQIGRWRCPICTAKYGAV